MTIHDLQQLNTDFGIKNDCTNLHFVTGKGDAPIVEIENEQARATICLQGAHLISWVPKGGEEVIWLSEEAKFAPGKSVRGGIPICWPWFGAHESNPDFPAHGFARTTPWQVVGAEELEDGRTRIVFTTKPLPGNEQMWPPQTSVLFQLTIGVRLDMELTTQNKGDQPITIGQALHTYFKIGDVSKVLVHGLDDTKYLDKLEDFAIKHQHGPITINKEIDRIYLDTITDCIIEDQKLNRNIIIKKCGSHSTVVWNPWQKTAEKMGDLGEEGYRKMLCVESCNAADDVVSIEPGKEHHLLVQYHVHKLK